MPTTVNKLKGTLHLGDTTTGKAMEAQVSTIGTPQTVTRDSPVVVLTGDMVQASAIYSWSLVGTVLADLSDPQGVFYYVQQHQGQQVPFTFQPIGASGPSFAGTVILDGWSTEELNAGSIVLSKFTWPLQGQLTTTPPAGSLEAE